jgi:hypothetical protein
MYLWRRELGEWARVAVPPDGLALVAADGGSVERMPEDGVPDRVCALIAPLFENGVDRAALVPAASARVNVRVNGVAAFPAWVLGDRDRIAVRGGEGDAVFYFSDGAIEECAFPAGREESCHRCGRPMQPGDETVVCACGRFLHEGRLASSDEEPRRCFSYDETCPCHRRLDDLRWTPGDDE